MAGVTLRTIRYYDKIGLLKPSHILDNGYRQYCNKDLITLQKILALKELGFSNNDIQNIKSLSIYDELMLDPDLSKTN